MPKLGVNVDHVATVRQARRVLEPDPVIAAAICEMAGCDSIVAHLREDRRHMQDRDIIILRKSVSTRLNLEMSIHKEIVGIARRVKPHQATLVPEKRQELTTEGGLDVAGNLDRIKGVVEGLKEKGIGVSLFIDPQENQLEASKKAGADAVELHTGRYADACLAGPPDPALPAGSWADRQAKDEVEAKKELEKLQKAVKAGLGLGLVVNAGHGLNYQNVSAVAHIQGIEELNIGHSIIARAVMVGLGRAVKEMKDLIKV